MDSWSPVWSLGLSWATLPLTQILLPPSQALSFHRIYLLSTRLPSKVSHTVCQMLPVPEFECIIRSHMLSLEGLMNCGNTPDLLRQ